MTRGHLLAAALIVPTLVVTGCGGGSAKPQAKPASASPTPSPTPTALTLHPVLEIKHGPSYSPNWRKAKAGCRGAAGLDELKVGAGVTIYGASGVVVGSGFVTQSYVQRRTCVLIATVDDVSPERYYKVQFVNRNKVAFSREQLETQSVATIFG